MIDVARKRLAVLADSFPSSELAADIHSLLAEVERLRAALQGIIANGHEQVENRAGDLYCVEACAACAADAALHARPGDDVARA